MVWLCLVAGALSLDNLNLTSAAKRQVKKTQFYEGEIRREMIFTFWVLICELGVYTITILER